MARKGDTTPAAAPEEFGASVEVLNFNGLEIPVDADFVSPGVTRHVEIGNGQVFMFLADTPRKLPPAAILPCLAQGVQIVR